MTFFSKDAPLNDYDKSLLAEIEALSTDKQQDAIALLFGAIVNDYQTASEEQRATMSPFCKFFAELDKSPDAQKPPVTAACNAGKITPIEKSSTSSQIVNQ
jgi:hypothetical protein